MEWLDDWGTKILIPDAPTADVHTLMPIEVHQHDDASDSKISRPISVAHRKLPSDFNNLDPTTHTRERKTTCPSMPEEGEEREVDREDIIRHRESRLNSL
jgi:hypothetical protein